MTQNDNNTFSNDLQVFWYHDCSINWWRVVIMTHQNLRLGKSWKLFWATLIKFRIDRFWRNINELYHFCKWYSDFPVIPVKTRKEKNASEGIPFFSKNFQWKGLFHLVSHLENRSFHSNGKSSIVQSFFQKNIFSFLEVKARTVVETSSKTGQNVGKNNDEQKRYSI